MILGLLLFVLGLLGFLQNRKNVVIMLIIIEIMLLSVTLMLLMSSYELDDIAGQTYSIYVICVAGAESALGLGLLVAYYRERGSIYLCI